MMSSVGHSPLLLRSCEPNLQLIMFLTGAAKIRIDVTSMCLYRRVNGIDSISKGHWPIAFRGNIFARVQRNSGDDGLSARKQDERDCCDRPWSMTSR